MYLKVSSEYIQRFHLNTSKGFIWIHPKVSSEYIQRFNIWIHPKVSSEYIQRFHLNISKGFIWIYPKVSSEYIRIFHPKIEDLKQIRRRKKREENIILSWTRVYYWSNSYIPNWQVIDVCFRVDTSTDSTYFWQRFPNWNFLEKKDPLLLPIFLTFRREVFIC